MLARRVLRCPTAAKGQVAVFDSAGAFVRTVGNYGAGPGELRDIVKIAIGPRDSLWIADESKRVTVFDAAGSRGRSFLTPGRVFDWDIPDAPGQLIMNLSYPMSVQLDPIVLYGEADPITADPPTRYALRETPVFRIAATQDGFHTVNQSTYEITRHDWSAKPRWTVQRAPEWYIEPIIKRSDPSTGAMIDVTAAADPLWSVYIKRLPLPKRPRAGPAAENVPRQLGADEILERYEYYIDGPSPDSARLITRWRSTVPITGFVDPGHVSSPETSASGETHVWVLRATLIDSSKRRNDR